LAVDDPGGSVMISVARVASLGALLGVAACGSKATPQAAPRAGSILAALLHAADQEKQPWRCAAPDTPTLDDEDLGHGWKSHGHTLARTEDDSQLVIGVIADAAGSAPRTIASLGRLRAQLDAANPDLVLALGGMGRDEKAITATLGTISDRAAWPVVALPGDLEPAGAHAAALAALRKRGDVVLDGRLVRWIEVAETTIGTLPGAGARERLVAGADGCAWTADDVARLYTELTARKGLRIVASAEAPRRIRDGEPSGELALVPPQPVDLALHAPTAPVPSPAATGSRDGAKTLLTPGTADATTRLPDAHSASAGVLVIRGDTWSWKPLVDDRRP
jgi:hypothetical protein